MVVPGGQGIRKATTYPRGKPSAAACGKQKMFGSDLENSGHVLANCSPVFCKLKGRRGEYNDPVPSRATTRTSTCSTTFAKTKKSARVDCHIGQL